jgi:hypothetical protein
MLTIEAKLRETHLNGAGYVTSPYRTGTGSQKLRVDPAMYRLIVAILFVACALPWPVIAAASQSVDPREIMLIPDDLPTRLPRRDDGTVTQRFDSHGGGTEYRVLFQSENMGEDLRVGPVVVQQRIYSLDNADAVSAFFAAWRSQQIEQGYAPVADAVNDSRTISLIKIEQELATEFAGDSLVTQYAASVQSPMIIATRWSGLLSRLSIQTLHALNAVSSGRYDSMTARVAKPAPTPVAPGREPAAIAAAPGPQIDPLLLPAWETLMAFDEQNWNAGGSGSMFRNIVETSRVRLVSGNAAIGSYGSYNRRTNTITISRSILGEDRRAIAAVLAHELLHVIQTAAGRGGRRECVSMEVEAYMYES